MSNIRIIFVDDDITILKGLKRRLKRLRRDWEVQFAPSGELALNALESGVVDVIVSDLQMPGINGAQLLERVKEKYAGCFRVALSGHAETGMILKASSHAHRVLAKPCDAEILVQIVEEGVGLLRKLSDPALKEWISGLQEFPQPSGRAQKFLEAMNGGDVALDVLESIIQDDVGLTASLLHISNGAYFGAGNVQSVSGAFQQLGLDLVRGIVLQSLIGQCFVLPEFISPILNQINSHCQQSIPEARELARTHFRNVKERDTLSTVCLLQDVGKLVFMAYKPELYRDVYTEALQGERNILDLESEAFGFDHAQVGALLLQLWGLPDGIVTAVGLHHSVYEHPNNASLATLLWFAGQRIAAKDSSAALTFMNRMSESEISPILESLDITEFKMTA
ncbi:MAG: HDOD domain-containing protein [Opitutales bacterium]